jgi:hypothetical protein
MQTDPGVSETAMKMIAGRIGSIAARNLHAYDFTKVQQQGKKGK